MAAAEGKMEIQQQNGVIGIGADTKLWCGKIDHYLRIH